jgi:hypothetical protein
MLQHSCRVANFQKIRTKSVKKAEGKWFDKEKANNGFHLFVGLLGRRGPRSRLAAIDNGQSADFRKDSAVGRAASRHAAALHSNHRLSVRRMHLRQS